MAFQTHPTLTGRGDLLDRHPKLEPLTWTMAGSTVDECDRAMEGALITFIDRKTNAEIAHVYTDVNGRFSAKLAQNEMGYRIKPYRYLWEFCPGFYDAFHDSDVACFRGKCLGKTEPK